MKNEFEIIRLELVKHQIEEELKFRKREVELKEKEFSIKLDEIQEFKSKKKWTQIYTPTGIAVIVALIGLFGIFFNNIYTSSLQKKKQHSDLILKVVESSHGDKKSFASVLLFYVQLGFLSFEERYIDTLNRIAGVNKGVSINLPVLDLENQSVEFTVNVLGNKALIEWHIENDNNVVLYEIQKSIDGINFKKIVNELPCLNSTIIPNHLIIDELDSTNSHSITYYRIRVFDIKGNEYYSSVKDLELNSKFNFRVFPNPFRKSINIIVNPIFTSPFTIDLYNTRGEIQYSTCINPNKNKDIINISEINKIPVGLYLLKIKYGNEIKTTLVEKI